MKYITKLMFDMWNMIDEDWMGYLPPYFERYDFHHIIKREHRGKLEIPNGAVLVTASHQYIHTIENYDKDMFTYINMILKVINEQGHMPNKKQLLLIDDVLKCFEREWCGSTTKKGKLIIKEDYTKRLIKRR